jgi:2-haloacid dehalogenase
MAEQGDAAAVTACVFDAYGTLLDLSSVLRSLDGELGPRGPALLETWRAKQLEYAWVRSLTGRFEDFWICTVEALDFAMARHGIDVACRKGLLSGYRRLQPFPDAGLALKHARRAGLAVVVLTNGSPPMVGAALASAGLSGLIDACLCIDADSGFKPSPAAYRLVEARLAAPAARIGFISSNAWDVAGAQSAGFRPVWINRTRSPDEYGLLERVPVAADLVAAVEGLIKGRERRLTPSPQNCR